MTKKAKTERVRVTTNPTERLIFKKRLWNKKTFLYIFPGSASISLDSFRSKDRKDFFASRYHVYMCPFSWIPKSSGAPKMLAIKIISGDAQTT